MKKLIAVLVILAALFFGLSVFANSTYFFNRYVASSIKEYGFGYDKVQGALLEGFSVDNLTYKNRPLSARAELKFNPVKLIYKKLSVSKLRLIGVNKEVLDLVLNDFKPKSDSSSSTDIALNFEIKNILLTIKPFNIQDIRVKKSAMSIDYIEYVNGKFNIGDVEYQAKSSIGNAQFSGRYEKRVLNIDNIELKNFNLMKFLPVLEQAQSSSGEDLNISKVLIPKLVNVKNASLTFSPFKIEGVSSKDLKLNIKNGQFDIKNFLLKKAEIEAKYSGNLAEFNSNMKLQNQQLDVKNLNLKLKKADILKGLKNYLDFNSSAKSGIDILKLKGVSLKDIHLTVDSFKFKDEKLTYAKANLKNGYVDLINKKIKLSDLNSSVKSTLADIKLDISADSALVIKNVEIKSRNLDRLISLFSSGKSESGSLKVPFLPKSFLIKNLKVNGSNISFEPFKIKKGELKAKDVNGTFEKFALNSGKLYAKVLSNWGKAYLKGDIKKNSYYAKGEYKPYQKLLDDYSIPLIAKHLKPLKVSGRFGFEDLDIDINLQGKDILTAVKNIDILNSKHKFKYNYKSGNIYWSAKGIVESVYTGKAKLKNLLIYKKQLQYSGEVIPVQKLSYAGKFGKLLDNLALNYQGNSSKIDLFLESDYLKGVLKSKNYSGGVLKIVNKSRFSAGNVFNADWLNGVKIGKIEVLSPIKFTKLLPLKGNMKIVSNAATINGSWSYDKKFKSNFILSSLNGTKELKLKKLSGLKVALEETQNGFKTDFKNSYLKGAMQYNGVQKSVKASLASSYTNIKAGGTLESLNIKLHSKSVKNSLKDFANFYPLKNIPNIQGVLDAQADIKNLKTAKLSFKSPKLTYINADKTTVLEDINLKGLFSKNSTYIESYKFKINGYKIFSNKPFKVFADRGNLKVNGMVVNNSLVVTGNYNIFNGKGVFKLKSNSFKLDNQDVKLNVALNTDIKINGERVSLAGKINILDGIIKKNLKSKNVAENEDIIILQRKAQKESTNFAKNIKLILDISSKNGLKYYKGSSHFILVPNLKISKNYGSLSNIQGVINIKKGGYYILKGKKLVLQKGVITFKGKSSSPNLNLVLNYYGREYEITVNISGTPTRPVLYFTSNPPLTKDQILAYLLFDDSSAAGTHSQEAMMSLVGGALAKSFLGSIGIKIDHISIKENGFSIGKSLGKHIIIYYNQDGEKASVKTRVNITKGIHTEIEVGDQSQSADIIFSKEY